MGVAFTSWISGRWRHSAVPEGVTRCQHSEMGVYNFNWRKLGIIFGFFRGKKGKKRRKSSEVVEYPAQAVSQGLNGKSIIKAKSEYQIKAHVCVSSDIKRHVASQEDKMMKVVVAPWSFSLKEAQERLERMRGNSQSYEDEDNVFFGDVEGLWDPQTYTRCLEYLPTQRQVERLEQLFNDDDKYVRATQLSALFGKGRYRCKYSMGPKRWNSFVQRERGLVEQHVALLKERWGRNFFSRCSKFVADGGDSGTSKSKRVSFKSETSQAMAENQRVSHVPLNVGIDMDTIKQCESLREKHGAPQFSRPKTAHHELHDTYDNKNDFRIGVRPFSS